MTVRLLLTAGALTLGLATAATAQGMQGQPGMDPGMQQGQMGGQQRPAMKRSPGKKMTKSMKGDKKMMRSRGSRMNQGGQDAGGQGGMSGADDGM